MHLLVMAVMSLQAQVVAGLVATVAAAAAAAPVVAGPVAWVMEVLVAAVAAEPKTMLEPVAEAEITFVAKM